MFEVCQKILGNCLLFEVKQCSQFASRILVVLFLGYIDLTDSVMYICAGEPPSTDSGPVYGGSGLETVAGVYHEQQVPRAVPTNYTHR